MMQTVTNAPRTEHSSPIAPVAANHDTGLNVSSGVERSSAPRESAFSGGSIVSHVSRRGFADATLVKDIALTGVFALGVAAIGASWGWAIAVGAVCQFGLRAYIGYKKDADKAASAKKA